jgi:hypothetical protein
MEFEDSKDLLISNLQKENEELKQTIIAMQTQLEKYTNNERHKKYYENNKAVVKEKAKTYLNQLRNENPDKIKEYRRRAYLKRRDKLIEENNY